MLDNQWANTARLQWGSLESNGIMKKIVYLVSEPRYVQRSEALLQVSHKKILIYISFQLFGVLSCVAISQTLGAIGKSVGTLHGRMSVVYRSATHATFRLWIRFHAS